VRRRTRVFDLRSPGAAVGAGGLGSPGGSAAAAGKGRAGRAAQRQNGSIANVPFRIPTFPAGAHQRALDQLEQKVTAEEAARASFAQSAPESNPSWTFIGPQPIHTPYSDPVVSGRVTALAVDPANVNTVYSGIRNKAACGRQQMGRNDLDSLNRQAGLNRHRLHRAGPFEFQATYLCGEPARKISAVIAIYGAGIFKSTNGGSTWTQSCGPFCGPVAKDGYYAGGARIGGLAVHPTNGQILLAAVALLSQDGVYRSTTGGNSWTRVLPGNPANSVLFDPTNGNIAYASLGWLF